MSSLTIINTKQEDEGMYHCAFVDWTGITWSATYLSLRGNSLRTSNYTVVQWSTVSDPVRPGDSVTLQCSVLSDSENKTCSEDHSVFWFRAGSDKSHPDIIYADGNRHDQCDKSQKRCVYRFSKNISSSDDGTYYCAVATCGEILFGNGSKLQNERTVSCKFTATVIGGMVCLIISVIGNIVFICYRTPRAGCEQFKGIESVSSQSQHDNSIPPVNDNTEGGDDLNYAALHLSGRKATRGRKKRETEESVYSQVKCTLSNTFPLPPLPPPIPSSWLPDDDLGKASFCTGVPQSPATAQAGRKVRVKMIVFCVTLLLFHQGYTLVPVTTVQLGEPVTFTCVFTDELNRRFHWYKQTAGENLKLIVSMWKNTSPVYGPDFSASRLEVKLNKNMSSLTILKTKEDDEGMYHCADVEWTKITWSATYLSLRGNSQRTSNYAVVQWSTVSDPVRPGGSVTLQCSVLSDSENKTCSEDHSVFWFRAGSDKSHPDIIYADGNRHDQCDKSQKRCVYHSSKNVSSSDDGTYYCAVATCGEILFGNGTKLQNESKTSSELIALVVEVVCLIISVTGNIVFICYRTPRAGCEQFKGIESVSSQSRHDNSIPPVNDNTESGDDLNYAALHLSGRKATRGRKKRETEESVYSQVKCRM
ncbi:uncharacterized protein LOC109138842 [Larimichthys crocea]|uniref:uncharacterized protein LOC109138842 n=1 Tax=Larimichthys crocea TaxID=215358 RepID=UPI000F5D9C19|nr:uncharacterized protein LOC109138842 [Larimichthys crocea]